MLRTGFALVKALRPKQWLKNGLLFAALVFSRHLFEPDFLKKTLLGVALFCLVSSSGYLFNDLLDIEADRGHPKKCKRPLASGALPIWLAVATMIIGAIVSVFFSFKLSQSFGFTTLAYLVLTVSYTFYIKHLVILDVMAIATLFILRAIAGATAIQVEISPWFLICISFGALFMAMSKRLSELKLLDKSAGKHRKNLDEYSTELLNRMISTVTAGSVMSYALYTFDVSAHPDKPQWLMLTIPFVLYGIFRYEYLVVQKGKGGAPEQILLSDRPFQINLFLYAVTAVAVLYLT